MKGDKVYTRYIDTTFGVAVMQFSDPETAAHGYMQDLTSPQPMWVDLPSGLHRGRLVIACVLDRTGALRNAQVIDAGEPVMTAKVLAALSNWKFSPALRGSQPVEVNAILGFGIDTSDRN
jgi:Gram-negative bacterial TonB protein C-terminal